MMRTKLSPRLQIFAAFVGRNRIIKKILSPFYDSYKKRIFHNKNAQFRKNGIAVFSEFDKLLTDNKIHYSVFAGTLLGAVREHGFIKHDMDIDIVMFAKDYSINHVSLFAAHGFKRIHHYEINNGEWGREETYEKNGVSIDIFYIYSDENYATYQCDFHEVEGSTSHPHSMKKYGYVAARRLEFPVSYETIRMPFETFEVSVIANYDEWLSYRYGKDYMVPNPDFHDKGTNPHIFEWRDIKAIYEED